MKTISLADAQTDLQALLDAAQKERILVHREGKPSVVIVGIEAYDEEDLQLANSAAFWQLIEERRKGHAEAEGAFSQQVPLEGGPRIYGHLR